MNRVIALEGIATSGKTTVAAVLENKYTARDISCARISEEESFLPVLELPSPEESTALLRSLLQEHSFSEEILVFDRFALSHLLLCKTYPEERCAPLTDMLAPPTLTVCLRLDEAAIAERVMRAMGHREESWVAHVRKKGTPDEILRYYVEQQRHLLGLRERLRIPSIVLDTTTERYGETAEAIIEELGRR